MGGRRRLLVASAVYNNLDLTTKMLDSLKTKHDLRVMLIDNGSKEPITKFINDFLARPGTSAIKYLDNKGVAYAWNRAIQHAIDNIKADFVLIVGNDTILSPVCIDRLVAGAEKHKASLITGTDYTKQCSKPQSILDFIVPEKEIITECPDFSCFMIRTEAVKELAEKEHENEKRPGLFDEKFFPAYFEDNDYHYRLQLAGLKAIKTNQASFYHYGSATKKRNPEIANQVSMTYWDNEAYFCAKWGGKPGNEKLKVPNKLWI